MKSLALAQLAPGPAGRAARDLPRATSTRASPGRTLVALAFILPSFVMTLAISWLYVRFGGLPWMQAAFYGVGAAVIGIIALAAYKLAKLTMAKDRLQWVDLRGDGRRHGVDRVRDPLAVPARRGSSAIVAQAPPAWLKRSAPACLAVAATPELLAQILWFFTKAGAFVFGSGLAIVPFLYGGVVQEYGWLNDKQFLDAVAVAMLTPGPDRHHGGVHRLPGGERSRARWRPRSASSCPSTCSSSSRFPWFDRISGNPKVEGVRGRGHGGGVRHHRRRLLRPRPARHRRRADAADRRSPPSAVAWRFKVPEPLLIAAGAAAGLIIFSLR